MLRALAVPLWQERTKKLIPASGPRHPTWSRYVTSRLKVPEDALNLTMCRPSLSGVGPTQSPQATARLRPAGSPDEESGLASKSKKPPESASSMLSFRPSNVALAESASPEHARSAAASVSPGSSQIWLMTGKYTEAPEGSLHSRAAVPPCVPAKNHTSLGWFLAQDDPSGSSIGFSATGTDSVQSHQRAGRLERAAPGVATPLGFPPDGSSAREHPARKTSARDISRASRPVIRLLSQVGRAAMHGTIPRRTCDRAPCQPAYQAEGGPAPARP